MVLTLSEDLDKFTFAQPELDFFKNLQFTFDMPADKASSKDQQQQQQRRRRNSSSQRQASSSHSRPSEGEASSDRSILQTDPHLPAQINSLYDFQSQYSGFLNQYLSSQHGVPSLLSNLPGPQPYPPIHDDPMTSLDRLLIPGSNRYPQSGSSSQPMGFPNPFGQQPIQPPPNLSSFFYESSSPYSHQSAGKTSAFPSFSPQVSQQPQPSASTSHHSSSLPSSSSATQASQQQQQQQGVDTITDTEDKRRRNTAASARFRMKKKQRTVNLERSVADLTGRAEELSREAADLRRENGWLKEIIVMRGRTLQRSSIPGEEYFMPPPRLQGSEQAGASTAAAARSTSSGDRTDVRSGSESEEEEEEEEEEKVDEGSSEPNASVSRSPPNRPRASSKRSKGKGKSRDPN